MMYAMSMWSQCVRRGKSQVNELATARHTCHCVAQGVFKTLKTNLIGHELLPNPIHKLSVPSVSSFFWSFERFSVISSGCFVSLRCQGCWKKIVQNFNLYLSIFTFSQSHFYFWSSSRRLGTVVVHHGLFNFCLFIKFVLPILRFFSFSRI